MSALLRMLLSGILLVAVCPAAFAADDFRVTTKIFLGDSKEPISENLTIFTRGVVYDFILTDPQEVSMFDPERNRFLLLSISRKEKTVIDSEKLLRFVQGAKVRAQNSSDSLAKFMAKPDFKETFTEESNKLVMKSSTMSYEVTPAADVSPEIAKAYLSFADWYAKLNATRLGGRPPFARIALDRKLDEKKLMPREIKLSIHSKKAFFGKDVVLRSEHIVTKGLLAEDRRRIERTSEQITQFKAVEFYAYRKAEHEAVAAKPDTKEKR